jgi:hypothetical protein
MRNLIFITFMFLSFYTKAPEITDYEMQTRVHNNWLKNIKLKKEKELKAFLFHLSLKESGHDWKITNRFGYMGKYQFGNAALEFIGMGNITTAKFKLNPFIFPIELQNIAVRKLLKANKKLLRKYMRFIGRVINGVELTKSGILAAAHLGGAGNVMEFIDDTEEDVFKDGNGTPITEYLIEFSGYNF